MAKPKVQLRCYNDRGDPEPPNNYRVEILIGTTTFVPAYEGRSGCMPKDRAVKLFARVRKALGLLPAPPEALD